MSHLKVLAFSVLALALCSPAPPRAPLPRSRLASTSARSRDALTATSTTRLTTARPTATTGPTGLTVGSSSEPAPGSTDRMASSATSITAMIPATVIGDRCRSAAPSRSITSGAMRPGTDVAMWATRATMRGTSTLCPAITAAAATERDTGKEVTASETRTENAPS